MQTHTHTVLLTGKPNVVWVSLRNTHAPTQHTHTNNVSHSQKTLKKKKIHPQTSTPLPLCSGGPGSGKGTQSLKIAERYGFHYVSVGELLRKKMIHNATSNRKWSLIAKIITNGELAPQVVGKHWRRAGAERGGSV